MLPVLTKLKRGLIPSKMTQLKVPGLSSSVDQVPEAEAQKLAEEGVLTDDPI